MLEHWSIHILRLVPCNHMCVSFPMELIVFVISMPMAAAGPGYHKRIKQTQPIAPNKPIVHHSIHLHVLRFIRWPRILACLRRLLHLLDELTSSRPQFSLLIFSNCIFPAIEPTDVQRVRSSRFSSRDSFVSSSNLCVPCARGLLGSYER